MKSPLVHVELEVDIKEKTICVNHKEERKSLPNVLLSAQVIEKKELEELTTHWNWDKIRAICNK
jgi:hypothetical protein